jgi:hypothetical protein
VLVAVGMFPPNSCLRLGAGGGGPVPVCAALPGDRPGAALSDNRYRNYSHRLAIDRPRSARWATGVRKRDQQATSEYYVKSLLFYEIVASLAHVRCRHT